jgi:DNA-binding LytR/AlgR family response regulator
VHRNWLVNLAYVKELERVVGGTALTIGSGLGPERRTIRAPVSHNRAKTLRTVLLKNATGLRHL